MRKRTIVVAGLAVALLAIGSLVRAGTKATGRVSITPGTLATRIAAVPPVGMSVGKPRPSTTVFGLVTWMGLSRL